MIKYRTGETSASCASGYCTALLPYLPLKLMGPVRDICRIDKAGVAGSFTHGHMYAGSETLTGPWIGKDLSYEETNLSSYIFG